MTRLKEYKVTITYPYQSRPTKQVIVSGINPRDAEMIAQNIYGGIARTTSENRGKKMKTFREFNEDVLRLTEAPTEAEAAKMAPGMSPEKRRAALERNARNQARRDTPSTPQDRMRRGPQKALPPGKSGGALQRAAVAAARSPAVRQTATSLAKKAGSAIVRSGSSAIQRTNQGNTGSAIVRTGSGGTSKEAVGQTSGDRAARKKMIDNPRGREEYEKGNPVKNDDPNDDPKKDKERYKGFRSGLNKGLGTKKVTDLFDKDQDTRRKARKKLGQKTGEAIRGALSKKSGGEMEWVSGEKISGPKTKGGYS